MSENRGPVEFQGTPTPEPEALKACPLCGGDHEAGFCLVTSHNPDTSVHIGRWGNGPAQDRKADGVDWALEASIQADAKRAVEAERDALKAQIERLTGDAAVEAACEAGIYGWTSRDSGTCINARLLMRCALAAALRAAKGEG